MKDRRPGALRRLWQAWLESSEAAVAIHYHAPWARAVRPELRPVLAARPALRSPCRGT